MEQMHQNLVNSNKLFGYIWDMNLFFPSRSEPLSINKRGVCLALIFGTLLISGYLNGQTYFTAEESFAVKLGTTRPLRESANMPLTDPEKLKDRKLHKPRIIPNFGGRRTLTTHRPDALPQGADPLADLSGHRTLMNTILPLINVEGIPQSASGATPPDVNGDVGKDYYVEIVNATLFRVYDKAGIPVSGDIRANTIWSQVQQSSAGDPIILYDQEVDRWFLTEFPSNNRVLVAISHTGDPLGSWDAYAFQTPRFPDFPKYGIWPDAYYLTTNEFGNNFPIYAINREDILAGAPMARIQRLTVPKIGAVSFEVGQPVDWDGLTPPPPGSPGLVVKLNDDDWGSTQQDEIILYKIFTNWDTMALSRIEVTSLPATPFDTDGCQLENTGGFSCVPQPNQQGIDGAQWIITNKAQYRNFGTHESFVMCFMVDVTGDNVAGIRWMEMRKTTEADWHIFQEGTIGSDDGIHRFMSSIGIDGMGNIGLAYSVSGYTKFPSLRYTGRYATDPPGVMSFEEFEFASGSGSQGFDRFGDYASMSVDPSDDATFWFAGQYMPSNNQWGTRIVAFKAHRDTTDVFPVRLETPVNDNILGEQEVRIAILNRGLRSVADFSVGYQFNEGNWVTEAAGVDSLRIDETLLYTFSVPVLLENPGVYPIRIATFLDADDNALNDTLSLVIHKYASRDVVLEYIPRSDEGALCAQSADHGLYIRNNGFETITSLALQIVLNGIPVDTIAWSGNLAFQAEIEYVFTTPDLTEGSNIIAVSVLEVNQESDEVPTNNEPEWMLVAFTEGKTFSLSLKTDNFPNETTWQLSDEQQNIIASGGPYAVPQSFHFSSFCLNPERCYLFTIFDAYGDGMNQGPKGYFEITNHHGQVVASLSRPNFGSQSSNQFCVTDTCMLTVMAGVSHTSDPENIDGVIMAESINGLGQIRYSLDGGMTLQSSGLFSGLTPGVYTVLALDDAGCSATIVVEILGCQLQAIISTVPASGGDVGEIHVTTSGANGPVTYSLQGGAFGQDSSFVMLEPGLYIVTIRDSLGCTVKDTVEVSVNVSMSSIPGEHFIRISPNPGKDRFLIEARFTHDGVFTDFTLMSPAGEILHHGSVVRYDETYHGELYLGAYPSGLYYVVFRPGQHLIVQRIFKVE